MQEICPLVPVERYLCFCPFLSRSGREMLATDPVSMAAGPQYMSFLQKSDLSLLKHEDLKGGTCHSEE